MYKNGDGVRLNEEEAGKWFRKAARQGCGDAQFELGKMCSNEEAVKWYRKAAEQGNPKAQNNLGVQYRHGEGVGQSHKEAAKWFQKAAGKKITASQFNLGLMYQNGEGMPQNYAKAAEWYDMENSVEAQLRLGEMYCNLGAMYTSEGMAKNFKEAEELFRKVVERENSNAQSNLGAIAQFHLGTMYKRGDGVEQSNEEAAKWFQKVAEQGDFRRSIEPRSDVPSW